MNFSLLVSFCFWALCGATFIVQNQVLVVAPDAVTAETATQMLISYGIQYQVLVVPIDGIALPALNNSDGSGNFALILIESQVSYYYTSTGSYSSALTTAQWQTIYDYQTQYGVRLIQTNVYPSSDFGTAALGGCCNDGDDQTVSLITSVAAKYFPTAGLKAGAVNLTGLWHYPSSVSDTTGSTTPFLTLGANSVYAAGSYVGVINNFSGREQMVFHTSFGTWSAVSQFFNHMWIHWGLRGQYGGFRRVLLSTQIDDLFLPTTIYNTTNTFRLRAADVKAHVAWQSDLNTRLAASNPGSNYFVEFGFNGNGNLLYCQTLDLTLTTPICAAPINYVSAQIVTSLEYQKPLGTGTDLWPANTTFDWTVSCIQNDPLAALWTTSAVRDVFGLVSHTFTHEGEDPITYADANREISYNQQYAKIMGLDQAAIWSPKSLIPPAITGLHNGDALQAWNDNGLTGCVGDNTRPPIRNSLNDHWPLITTVANNGYAGFQISPRWATRIYYNCDMQNCTVLEWIQTSSGAGDIFDLLNLERSSTAKSLLGLYHDPYMFHQANLRQTDVDMILINGATSQYSLLQMWVESVLNEFSQYASWPIITKKFDDMSADFLARMNRDLCNSTVSNIYSSDGQSIVGAVVAALPVGSCTALIPVTMPGPVTSANGQITEQIGSDPLTIWADVSKGSQTFMLVTPVKISATGPASGSSSSSPGSSSMSSTSSSSSLSSSGPASLISSSFLSSSGPSSSSSSTKSTIPSSSSSSPSSSPASSSKSSSTFAPSTKVTSSSSSSLSSSSSSLSSSSATSSSKTSSSSTAKTSTTSTSSIKTTSTSTMKTTSTAKTTSSTKTSISSNPSIHTITTTLIITFLDIKYTVGTITYTSTDPKAAKRMAGPTPIAVIAGQALAQRAEDYEHEHEHKHKRHGPKRHGRHL